MSRRWLYALGVVIGALLVPASAGAATFSNPTPFTIPIGSGPATPFSTSISVSGINHPVSRVQVGLFGITESNPNVIDVLLVAPSGQKVILMSDNCGSDDIAGRNFFFLDGAPLLPASCVASTGSFRPNDGAPAETSFLTGPPAPYGTTLSPLASSPNGVWTLFVKDGGGEVQAGPTGTIAGGWALDLAENPGSCAGQAATHTGTDGDDTIAGTAGPDVIAAGGGNDKVTGANGKDLVCGGAGKDTLAGGKGKDRLLGEAGKDKLKGGKGKDKLIGAAGKDKLSGGGANDVCKGGKGKDRASSCEKERSI